MNYKPDEKDWMAYLYGELEGEEKERMDQHVLENAEARVEFENYKKLRSMLGSVEDKEVIAPPIFVGETGQRFLWNAPYFKMIVSIAASLLIVILIGKITDTRITISNNEFKLSFGEVQEQKLPETQNSASGLTAEEVQQMINSSLNQNNTSLQVSMKESQQKLDASIRKNLALNSGKIDQLMRDAANASQEQVRQYVASLQDQNITQMKDYFQLTSADQKKYIENLVMDFNAYLQEQRKSDLQLVQTKLQSLEQNSSVFQKETEQILTSIITSVGSNQPTKETRN